MSPRCFVSRGQGCHLPAVWPNSPTKGKFLDSALFFGHDPRQSRFSWNAKKIYYGGGPFSSGAWVAGVQRDEIGCFFGSQTWEFFRPKKRRESFSRREECAILTAKRESKSREQKRFYGQLHARFTSMPYWRRWY